MKSERALQRDLKNIANRITKDDEQGKDPDPDDLAAMKETVDLLIERLKSRGQ
jgi:hypothetical protein